MLDNIDVYGDILEASIEKMLSNATFSKGKCFTFN